MTEILINWYQLNFAEKRQKMIPNTLQRFPEYVSLNATLLSASNSKNIDFKK